MPHADPIGLSRHHWDTWSSTPEAAEQGYANAAAALGNLDFARVMPSAYCDDLTDSRYEDLETELASGATIDVETIIYPGADPLEPGGADTEADRSKFTNLTAQHVADGAGHFVHVERPDTIIDAITQP